MTLSTPLTRILDIDLPIIQAPMAGGPTTPELVAAVSNAGGLGALAGAILTPEQIISDAQKIRTLTKRPFAINLFVLETPSPDEMVVTNAWDHLAPLHKELGIDPELPTRWCQSFEQQFEALLRAEPAVASFTFGILDKVQMDRLHAAHIFVIGTATRPEEAKEWAALGADAISAQGSQAGGHRGTFIGSYEDALIDTGDLVEGCVEAVGIPVIAAGGIMDGYDIAVQLAHGAQAAQLGTAFLATVESGIPSSYKQALLEANGETQLTRGFSGRMARGLPNRAMRVLSGFEKDVPEYPVQNALTGALRAEGKRRNDAEYLSLWAGTGVIRVRSLPAEELVVLLAAELEEGADS